MYSIVAVLSIILAIVLMFSGWAATMAVKLFVRGRKYRNDAKKYAEKMKARTDAKYNKYIALTPQELDERLGVLFAAQLELCSVSAVAETDPEAIGKLYALAVAGLLNYIGPESIAAIEYYYGSNYVVRWCELKYKLLENRGILSKIIDKEMYLDKIAKELTGA